MATWKLEGAERAILCHGEEEVPQLSGAGCQGVRGSLDFVQFKELLEL